MNKQEALDLLFTCASNYFASPYVTQVESAVVVFPSWNVRTKEGYENAVVRMIEQNDKFFAAVAG